MNEEQLGKLLISIEKRLKSNSFNNEWDNILPVISEENKHTAYITHFFEEPSVYNKLCHKLTSANEYEEFLIVINSPGGVLDSAFMVADAIRQSKAKVTCKLVGTVASAATIVALSCDELTAAKNLAFMIHNYSTGMQGKGHELKAYQKFTDQELNKTFREYYLGFLTEDEMEDVINGRDIWLNTDEVQKRWKNKKNKV